MRHLLDITDLTADELVTVLNLAERPHLPRSLSGLGAAHLFETPSTRTRQSMEMAVVQLGGHPIYTRGDEVGFDVRETVEDVTRVMAGYHGMLAARVFDHGVVQRMAAVDVVPIVNLLSDHSHPLQALADTLTMRQVHGPLTGQTVAYVGDYNNVARSLAEACVLIAANLTLGCPVGFDASGAELERLNLLGEGRVVQVHRPIDAVAGAIAVHTDTWTSMGQEAEKEDRKQAFEGYTVTTQMMAGAAPNAGFYHCLPAYRGFEVAADVIDGLHSYVIPQSHNRLHASRAAMAFLMGVR